jgi:hypothetical protein
LRMCMAPTCSTFGVCRSVSVPGSHRRIGSDPKPRPEVASMSLPGQEFGTIIMAGGRAVVRHSVTADQDTCVSPMRTCFAHDCRSIEGSDAYGRVSEKERPGPWIP